MKRRAMLFLFSLLVLPVYVSAQTSQKTEAAVMFERLLMGLNNTDFNAVLDLFADDVLFWGTSTKTLGTDSNGPRTYFASLAGGKPGVNVASALDYSVREGAGGIQLLSGTWQVNIAGRDSKPVFRLSMAVAMRNGKWKIVQFHNSAMPQ